MGLGPTKGGKQLPITQHAGSWADTANKTPMPTGPMNTALAIGKCNADGSGFTPYEKPVPRLWKGDYRL
jgi:hypothetical protein